MPEVMFTIEMPGGETHTCYSPSSVVKKYFAEGEQMSVAEFLSRSTEALTAASERVRAKYGVACTAAAAQLNSIEQWSSQSPPDGIVSILSI